jgi:small ligand-binding sensory domain FIST
MGKKKEEVYQITPLGVINDIADADALDALELVARRKAEKVGNGAIGAIIFDTPRGRFDVVFYQEDKK